MLHKYSTCAINLCTEDFYTPAPHAPCLAREAPMSLPGASGFVAVRSRVIVRPMNLRPISRCVTTLDSYHVLRGTQGPRPPQRGCFGVEDEVESCQELWPELG